MGGGIPLGPTRALPRESRDVSEQPLRTYSLKTIIYRMPEALLTLRKDLRQLSDTVETTPARVASLGPTGHSVTEWRGAQGSVAAAAE